MPARFAGADMSTKLKLMGVDVASIGDAQGRTAGSRAFQYIDERKQVYKKIVVSSCGKKLLGAVMVGDAAEYGTLLQMALNGIALPEPRVPDPAAADGKAKPGLGVDALPDTAQICSCNDVSKGKICAAVSAAHQHRRTEVLHQGRHHLRRLRAAGHAGDEGAR
jgi:nitrite reductase (NADH) large subunit